MNRQIYILHHQLHGKPKYTAIGTILTELRVCSVQGVFWSHIRIPRSVLSAGCPVANQSNLAREVRLSLVGIKSVENRRAWSEQASLVARTESVYTSIFTCKTISTTRSHLPLHDNCPTVAHSHKTIMSTDPRRRAQPPPPPPPPETEPDTTTMGLDGADERQQPTASNGQTQKPGEQPPSNANESFKLKFCTVCASNNNRYFPTPSMPPTLYLIN